jgi:hypothetical protein
MCFRNRSAVRLYSCLVVVSLVVLFAAHDLEAGNPLSRYESGDRVFREYEVGNLIVYWHQRMIDEAFVEKDYIVYQFDKATEELVAVRSHWREDLPEHLPANLVSRSDAEALVDGKVLRSSLYIISPESDVYPLEPTPENPCWIVWHQSGGLVITIIDAVTGAVLGNGIPPPYEGFSLSGPWDFNPCSGTWTSWRQNAASWFATMGYSTESAAWPTESQVRGHVQSC